ncbi:hypothetical protein BLS_009206 [Venturia inaequalis]|uniref:Uncharacterized protein n=1 Tax=Venturia inaequalis TaxID=5025 RepID=A0A8H3U4Z2_VENIN|nr:hypothetical protein BLS_009206 [Venturia inaequalis]
MSPFDNITSSFVGTQNSVGPYFYATLGNLRLDIVGFLAILGESSMLETSQIAARLQGCTGFRERTGGPWPWPATRSIPKGTGKASDTLEICYSTATMTGTHDTLSVRFGRLWLLSFFGAAQSVVLLALAVTYRDGIGILAVALLSLVSTLVGVGHKWSPSFRRKINAHGPSTMSYILRYLNGSFVVVQCSEALGSQLFLDGNTANLEYLVNERVHHYLSTCCTVMLMLGILAVANSQIQTQIAFACAYISLNAAYLAMTNTSARTHWDLSSLKIRRQKINVHGFSEHRHSFPEVPEAKDPWINYNFMYTEALWKAIAVTKNSEWCKQSSAVPSTAVWKRWLNEAQEEAQNVSRTTGDDGETVWELPNWDSYNAYVRLLTKPLHWELESLVSSTRSSNLSPRGSLEQAQL